MVGLKLRRMLVIKFQLAQNPTTLCIYIFLKKNIMSFKEINELEIEKKRIGIMYEKRKRKRKYRNRYFISFH